MYDHTAFGSEVKCALSARPAQAVRDWARAEMQLDPHSTGAGGYRTTTLYFDTPAFDLFYRRGSFGRAKFRIRRYNESPVVYLERKLRIGDHVTKWRSEIPIEDLARFSSRDRWEGAWFARRLEHRKLRPVCQVVYVRTAYVAPGMRLTLDEGLTASAIDEIAFADHPGSPVMPQQMILEFKFGAEMPDAFAKLIEEHGLTPHTVSKYRLAMNALGMTVAAVYDRRQC